MGYLSPMDTEDRYAVIDPIYGIDGLRNVETLEHLNLIPEERRRAGMIVGVNGGDVYYKLKNISWTNDITDWIEIDFTNQISVDKETPQGVINGTNTIFTINYLPITNSEHIYLNGLLQDNDDYMMSGNTISFFEAPYPNSKIKCSYRTI